jgi:D-alanine-D-alanine ligase
MPYDRKLRVALVCNTRRREGEFEVEYDPPDTIEKVRRGIENAGFEYLFIEADEDAYEKLRRLRPDLVFNRAEGIRGESRESHIPAFCEMLGIPYVGSGILTTAICLDKPTTKMILEYHGIKTAPFQVFRSLEEPLNPRLRFPLILKPSHEGSSMGINIDNVVYDEGAMRKKLHEMLEAYRQPILVEEFIDGREFSVGLLGNYGPGEEPRVLPILEVDFTRFPKELGNVLGQKAKTIYDSSKNYICPAEIPDELRRRLEEISKRAFRVLDCKDFARLDFRMDREGELYFLEINPLPGIDYNVEADELSFYPMMCYAAGMDYDEMIRQIIEAALRRYGIKPTVRVEEEIWAPALPSLQDYAKAVEAHLTEALGGSCHITIKNAMDEETIRYIQLIESKSFRPELQYSVDELISRAKNEDFFMVTAYLWEHPMAFAFGYRDPRERDAFYIDTVASTIEGRGVGSALITLTLLHCLQGGYKLVNLHTEEVDEKGRMLRRFYERLGFEPLQNNPVEGLLMRMRLEEPWLKALIEKTLPPSPRERT